MNAKEIIALHNAAKAGQSISAENGVKVLDTLMSIADVIVDLSSQISKLKAEVTALKQGSVPIHE